MLSTNVDEALTLYAEAKCRKTNKAVITYTNHIDSLNDQELAGKPSASSK